VIVVLDGTVKIPFDCFAITYPKTSLTQKGIHVLNTGIVDPGYDGCLSTIIINYSKNEVELRRKEDVCFRLMLYKNETPYLNWGACTVERFDYIQSRIADSKKYPDTFLDIRKQQDGIIKKVTAEVTKSVATTTILIIAVLTLLLQAGSSFIETLKKNDPLDSQVICGSENTNISSLEEEMKQIRQQLDDLKK
jgi:hypothetical protein